MPTIVWVLLVAGGLFVVARHKGTGGKFTPSDQPPPPEVEKLVAAVLAYENDLVVLRVTAQKLTQAGYGAQAAQILRKAFAVEAKALGLSQVQLAMQRSSMFSPGYS